jgi:hypothetical protein
MPCPVGWNGFQDLLFGFPAAGSLNGTVCSGVSRKTRERESLIWFWVGQKRHQGGFFS